MILTGFSILMGGLYVYSNKKIGAKTNTEQELPV